MAGKPIRDKDIPGKQVNGQKSKKKCHVLGITEEGVFPGLSSGGGRRMINIL